MSILIVSAIGLIFKEEVKIVSQSFQNMTNRFNLQIQYTLGSQCWVPKCQRSKQKLEQTRQISVT